MIILKNDFVIRVFFFLKMHNFFLWHAGFAESLASSKWQNRKSDFWEHTQRHTSVFKEAALLINLKEIFELFLLTLIF